MNQWNVQIVLESLNNDAVTWIMSDQDLEQLRTDIRAGELGRAHISRVLPVQSIGLVAAAA